MAEYKYFFNDKPVSEQEWYEIVKVDEEEKLLRSHFVAGQASEEEQLSLF